MKISPHDELVPSVIVFRFLLLKINKNLKFTLSPQNCEIGQRTEGIRGGAQHLRTVGWYTNRTIDYLPTRDNNYAHTLKQTTTTKKNLSSAVKQPNFVANNNYPTISAFPFKTH